MLLLVIDHIQLSELPLQVLLDTKIPKVVNTASTSVSAFRARTRRMKEGSRDLGNRRSAFVDEAWPNLRARYASNLVGHCGEEGKG